MSPNHRIKSFLGVAIVVVSVVAGGILIFSAPEDPKPPPPVNTKLKVTLKATGPDGLALIRNINCPADKVRCPKLSQLKPDDFVLPEGQVCASVYGGPSVAEVYGVLDGRPLKATLKVTDSCQIEQWNRLAPALGLPASDAGKKAL